MHIRDGILASPEVCFAASVISLGAVGFGLGQTSRRPGRSCGPTDGDAGRDRIRRTDGELSPGRSARFRAPAGRGARRRHPGSVGRLYRHHTGSGRSGSALQRWRVAVAGCQRLEHGCRGGVGRLRRVCDDPEMAGTRIKLGHSGRGHRRSVFGIGGCCRFLPGICPVIGYRPIQPAAAC